MPKQECLVLFSRRNNFNSFPKPRTWKWKKKPVSHVISRLNFQKYQCVLSRCHEVTSILIHTLRNLV